MIHCTLQLMSHCNLLITDALVSQLSTQASRARQVLMCRLLAATQPLSRTLTLSNSHADQGPDTGLLQHLQPLRWLLTRLVALFAARNTDRPASRSHPGGLTICGYRQEEWQDADLSTHARYLYLLNDSCMSASTFVSSRRGNNFQISANRPQGSETSGLAVR